MSNRLATVWAIVTSLLCLLVMLGLAFTGPLALAGAAVVLLLSLGARWLIMRLARTRR